MTISAPCTDENRCLLMGTAEMQSRIAGSALPLFGVDPTPTPTHARVRRQCFGDKRQIEVARESLARHMVSNFHFGKWATRDSRAAQSSPRQRTILLWSCSLIQNCKLGVPLRSANNLKSECRWFLFWKSYGLSSDPHSAVRKMFVTFAGYAWVTQFAVVFYLRMCTSVRSVLVVALWGSLEFGVYAG